MMGQTLAELRRELQDAKDECNYVEVNRLTATIKLREKAQLVADFEATQKFCGL